MPVKVDIPGEGSTLFDNGKDWRENTSGSLDVLNSGSEVIGTFAPGSWWGVKKSPREDQALLFEEAMELLKNVDNGNFGNQDSDWQERADSLINQVK